MAEAKDSSVERDYSPIPYARQSIDEADIEEVVAALKSDFVTQGPRIERFESALAEYTGARYAIAVSSGTAALHLSCLGLDIGKEGIGYVPAITFAATANCVRYVGGRVEFVDTDPKSGLSTARDFGQAYEFANKEGKKSVFFPVSYSGSARELPEIAKLGRQLNAFVVEDAAHSIGARYVDESGAEFRSGSCSHSDAAILSFHPVKHICAGEGGAVLTNDETLARRVKRLRTHGVERAEQWLYDQVELGFHYRMTELQAALGMSQLQKIDVFLERRREIARVYDSAFLEADFSDLEPANTDPSSAHHLYVVRFEQKEVREAAYDYLRERNIGVQVHYFPVYKHSYYKGMGHGPLVGAEAFYNSCLSLPMYPALRDDEQARVIDCLREFFGSR